MNEFHDEFGPSKLGRLAACPGSYGMSEEAARRGLQIYESEDAGEEGTSLHERMHPEKSLDGLNGEQAYVVGEARKFISSHMASMVDVEYEKLLPLWRSMADAGVGSRAGRLTYGRLDVMGVDAGGIVRIVDLKFGRAAVDRESVELQMRAYAAMAMQYHTKGKAEVWVYQPRAQVEYQGMYDYSDEIPESIADVIKTAKLAASLLGDMDTDVMQLRPSRGACRFCSAKGICPAFDQALHVVRTESRGELSMPGDWARMLDIASMAEPWAKEVKRRAKEKILGGMKVPGWAIKQRRVRVIRDALKALEALRHRLPPEKAMAALERLPVGALEEAYIEACKSELSAKDARGEFEGVLGACIEYDVQQFLTSTED